MNDFKSKYRVEINPQEAVENSKDKEFKDMLGFYLGSVLHEDWKKDDEAAYLVASDEKKAKNWELGEDGTLRKFKSVDGNVDGKKFEDRTFEFKDNDPAYRKDERKIDIRALTFDRLPLVWQKENADAGRAAMELVYDKVKSGETIDIEAIAAEVHKAWLSRPNNSWAIEYQSEESKPYEELSEEVKAKDRRHVELALEILDKVKDGTITYDGLKEQVGTSMNKFNSQMKEIEETTK